MRLNVNESLVDFIHHQGMGCKAIIECSENNNCDSVFGKILLMLNIGVAGEDYIKLLLCNRK